MFKKQCSCCEYVGEDSDCPVHGSAAHTFTLIIVILAALAVGTGIVLMGFSAAIAAGI